MRLWCFGKPHIVERNQRSVQCVSRTNRTLYRVLFQKGVAPLALPARSRRLALSDRHVLGCQGLWFMTRRTGQTAVLAVRPEAVDPKNCPNSVPAAGPGRQLGFFFFDNTVKVGSTRSSVRPKKMREKYKQATASVRGKKKPQGNMEEHSVEAKFSTGATA